MQPAMTSMPLRALAFGLVILYHVACSNVADWAGTSRARMPRRAAMADAALNLWRMDLCGSGFGAGAGDRVPQRPACRPAAPAQQAPAASAGLRHGRDRPPTTLRRASQRPGRARSATFLLLYFSGGPWPAGAFDGWEAGVTWNHLWYCPTSAVHGGPAADDADCCNPAAGQRVRHGSGACAAAGCCCCRWRRWLSISLRWWPTSRPATT